MDRKKNLFILTMFVEFSPMYLNYHNCKVNFSNSEKIITKNCQTQTEKYMHNKIKLWSNCKLLNFLTLNYFSLKSLKFRIYVQIHFFFLLKQKPPEHERKQFFFQFCFNIKHNELFYIFFSLFFADFWNIQKFVFSLYPGFVFIYLYKLEKE